MAAPGDRRRLRIFPRRDLGARMSSITMRLREGTTGAVAERDAEFAWFFRNEFEALVRTMYLIVHDREQARDIAQEAFVQLFTRWRRISQYERPEAWVRRVGIRMAVRAIRRDRLRPRLERELDVALLPKPAMMITPPPTYLRSWDQPTGDVFTVAADTIPTNALGRLCTSSIGTYTWVLRDDRLTLAPVTEDCAARRALLTTTAWVRQ